MISPSLGSVDWCVEIADRLCPLHQAYTSPTGDGMVHLLLSCRDYADFAHHSGLMWVQRPDMPRRFAVQVLSETESGGQMHLITSPLGWLHRADDEGFAGDDYLLLAPNEPIQLDHVVLLQSDCVQGTHTRLELPMATWRAHFATGARELTPATTLAGESNIPLEPRSWPGHFRRVSPASGFERDAWLDLVRLRSRQRFMVSLESVNLLDGVAVIIGHQKLQLSWNPEKA